jgi:hypothetical protein
VRFHDASATPARAKQRGGVRFCRVPPRPHEHGRNSTPAGSSAERIFYLKEAGFVNCSFCFIGWKYFV